MVHRKPAKGACIAVRENEFQTFESHKDKEISLLFKQFAKKTTKKPRLFHLKTDMSDGFYGMTQRKNPWHETNKTSDSPKKNCAYSTYSIVFGDQWVNCLFGSFAHLFYGGGGWVPIFRVCSDLDQNRAILWSKSEMKHPKHPKHLKHLKHLLWMLDCFFVNISKNLVAKLRMACTEGKTKRECCLFWGG